MSDPSPTSPDANLTPAKLSGGCIMIMIVGGWILALGGWMIWHLMGQVKEIRGFTDAAPQALTPVSPGAEEKKALQDRMAAFGAAVEAKTAAKLELSVLDLNHLLAAQPPIDRLKDIAIVEEITDSIRVKVALALNGIPMTGERLYLNGFIHVRPELKKDSGLILLTRSIEVTGRTLTPGFTQTYLEANHLDGLALDEVRKDNKLSTLLSKLSAIRCEPGKVIVEYLP